MNYIYEMPEELLKEPVQRGSVEHFEYDTFTYDEEESRPLKKSAWVYVPYGYGKDKPYPVLYLMHGGGENENWWFKKFPETVTILDNMILQKICVPCIIVTPTFYRDDEMNRNAEYVTENFHKELRNDLIPAIEARYSTYAGDDVSEKNLIVTRDYRAFAGLSLGSMATYRAAFYNNFDLFSWYGPFSGCCGPKGDRDIEVGRIQKTLSEGEAKGLPLKYLFCCNGDKDIAYEEHVDIMTRALKICPQLKEGENYDFFTIPGGIHDMKAWQLHLYHALQIFFK